MHATASLPLDTAYAYQSFKRDSVWQIGCSLRLVPKEFS